MLKGSVSGKTSLKKEFEKLEGEIAESIPAGLKQVGSDMVMSLQRHIQTEVYEVYRPYNYKRRKGDGGMIDSQFMDYTVSGNRLLFNYDFPTSPSSWKKGRGQYYEFEDGDDAIRAIQSGGPYPTISHELEPRPFWTMFMLDFFQHGEADESFVKGMRTHKRSLEVQSDGASELDTTDIAEIDSLIRKPQGQAVEMRGKASFNQGNPGKS